MGQSAPTGTGKPWISKSQLPWFLALFLLLTNVATLYTKQTNDTWYMTQFDDNYELTQNHMDGVRFSLLDILEAGGANQTKLRELRDWAEMASTQAATVTYLDTRHFDLWTRVSHSMILLEAFTEDLMNAIGEGPLSLDEYSASRLSEVYENLSQAMAEMFPDDAEANPWANEQYERMDRAMGEISKLEKSTARCWLVITHIVDPGLPPPEVIAETVLKEQVGEDYFNTYFTGPAVHYNTNEIENWLVSIIYNYHVEVGSYQTLCEVHIQFDKAGRLLRTHGLPSPDNLQPFTITREQAVETAKTVVTKSYVETDADIYWVRHLPNGTKAHLYLWSVNLYHTAKSNRSGTNTQVLVDPKTGEILGAEEYGWSATS